MDLLQTAKLILVMAACCYTALEFIHGFSFLSRCVIRVLRGRNYLPRFILIYSPQKQFIILKITDIPLHIQSQVL
jgi:hypothetical protein